MSGSFLEIDVDLLLEFRSKRYVSELEREPPVVCFFYYAFHEEVKEEKEGWRVGSHAGPLS